VTFGAVGLWDDFSSSQAQSQGRAGRRQDGRLGGRRGRTAPKNRPPFSPQALRYMLAWPSEDVLIRSARAINRLYVLVIVGNQQKSN